MNDYSPFERGKTQTGDAPVRRFASDTDPPRVPRADYKGRKKKQTALRIGRGVIQLIAFLLIPGLFVSVFSAIGAIWTALITGSFVFAEQLATILLVSAVLLLTLLWGRFFCGFICSFGAMQDFLRWIGRHISKRNLVPEKADRVLKYLKYAVLVFVVIGVWTLGVGANLIWSPWTVFGAYASPFSGFPTEAVFLSLGGALLLLTIVGSMFIDRFFCRYLCPLGAIFTLLSRFRVFKIKKPSTTCGNCRLCSKSCPMGIPLNRYDKITSGECINCMNCTAACYRGNVRAQALPAVSGTVAAMTLAGVTFAGALLPNTEPTPAVSNVIRSSAAVGRYQNGVYSGSASGYRGEISVSVTVENGYLSDITVLSSRDDRQYLNMAENGVIPAILTAQNTDVAAVSGATYSSRGIINAVNDALASQIVRETIGQAAEESTQNETVPAETIEPTVPKEIYVEEAQEDTPDDPQPETEAQTESTEQETPQGVYADGVYTGYGSGYRGATCVSVTVEGGVITDVTVLSYSDDAQFFNRACSTVIDEILYAQSVDVSTVSGATFSSNSIREAVANALGLAFTNPNSSMSGGHGHH